MRGFYGVGIEHGKNKMNYGTLFRTALIYNADFVFLVGKRFQRQSSDTYKSWRYLPTYDYDNVKQMYENMPYNCKLVGVELCETAKPIYEFKHPERAIYLLGAEDNGLTKQALQMCHEVVQLPGDRSLNVSVAGSIVLFDRINKLNSAK